MGRGGGEVVTVYLINSSKILCEIFGMFKVNTLYRIHAVETDSKFCSNTELFLNLYETSKSAVLVIFVEHL